MARKRKESEVASFDEVLRILTAQARSGSVTAAAALARELRAAERRQESEVDAAIDRILETKG